MQGVRVCLMKRTSNGKYLQLYYNCADSYLAASQSSHYPCGRQENHGKLIPYRAPIPFQAILPVVPLHTMQISGYGFLTPVLYPSYVAGVPLSTFSRGHVNGPLSLS